MIFDLMTPLQGPRVGAKKIAVARPIHVSYSHTKFGWISSIGLGGKCKHKEQTLKGMAHGKGQYTTSYEAGVQLIVKQRIKDNRMTTIC